MKFVPYTFLKRKKVFDLRQKIETLQRQINEAQSFIKQIEEGNLAIEFRALNAEEDVLAASLLSMRDQMSRIADDEKKRNWATEGLAKFVDILRSKNDDLKELGEVIVSNIVRYMNANQGSLYILNDDNQDDIHLEMIACYAYNRKKFINQKIEPGQGLVGQAVLEKESIYMTNIPDNYLKITSGLGEALPKNLLIVPLIMNDVVYGVIEMASFHIFQEHHREFIGKLAESIASTIANAKVNQQTRTLLEETQAQAEQMRSQEEEMRQNMEELTATQEEMQRVLNEVQGKEGYISQLLNVTQDSIFTFDHEYRLVTWNEPFAKTLGKFGLTLQKGMSVADWYQGEERAAQIKMYDRALLGETFEFTTGSEMNGVTHYFLSIYAPLRNDKGDITEAAAFTKDVTAMMTAQKNAEKLANEAQQQTEELKAQEEELRQNMEELSATQEEMQRIMNEMEAKGKYVHQLLNVYSDSIFTVDREYKLATWNDAFAALFKKFGMDLQKGSNTLDWYQGEEREKNKKMFDRAFGGETFDFTTSSELEGVANHFLSVYAPLKDDSGKVFEVAVFAKDLTAMISAQKTAEAEKEKALALMGEVKEQESYLNAIMNASKDSIFTIDREYNIISYNAGFSTGLEQAGMKVTQGMNVLDVFPDENDRKKQIDCYKRAFKGEAFEVTNKYVYGDLVTYYTSSFSPLKNVQGEIYALAIFGKDVTAFMNAKDKAEALAHEAKEANEEMKAQEEELRQNLEELSASQDEMRRIMNALETKESYVNELLNASDDLIFTVDHDYKLVSWNKSFEVSLSAYGTTLAKGFNTLEWYPDAKAKKEQRAKIDRVFKGETIDSVMATPVNDQQTMYFRNISKPMRNANDEIFEVAVFARDITASEIARIANEQALSEINERDALMREVINGCRYEIYAVDRNFRFIHFNESMHKTLASLGVEVEVGGDVLAVLPDKKQRDVARKQLERVFKGEAFDIVQEFTVKGNSKHVFIHYKPIKNLSGEVVAAGIYTEDITELMTIKKQNTELLARTRNDN